MLQYHLEAALGFMVCFPDMSNTRYQCYCEAAAELLVHHHFYVEFFEMVRDKKDKPGFNHMESNVYKGLLDIPTQTELAVLMLYSQAISHPYMRQVRGPGHEVINVLDLGPLHDEVKAHIHVIICNPGLLISASTDFRTGAMDQKIWHCPEAFYAVQRDADWLPHHCGALVAFFEGALETWEHFTSKFTPDGLIANSTAAQQTSAFLNPTNDHNEGALGSFHVGMRQAPRMSLHQYNLQSMYKQNKTSKYIKYKIRTNPNSLQFLKKRACAVDSSKLEQSRRLCQAKHNLSEVQGKHQKAKVTKQKKDTTVAKINAVSPRLNADDIHRNPGTNPELELQLD
jgi:hypothetical protein